MKKTPTDRHGQQRTSTACSASNTFASNSGGSAAHPSVSFCFAAAATWSFASRVDRRGCAGDEGVIALKRPSG